MICHRGLDLPIHNIRCSSAIFVGRMLAVPFSLLHQGLHSLLSRSEFTTRAPSARAEVNAVPACPWFSRPPDDRLRRRCLTQPEQNEEQRHARGGQVLNRIGESDGPPRNVLSFCSASSTACRGALASCESWRASSASKSTTTSEGICHCPVSWA